MRSAYAAGADFDERAFDRKFAAWKAARLLPKGKRLDDGAEAFVHFARTFEAQLELEGYRLVEVELREVGH